MSDHQYYTVIPFTGLSFISCLFIISLCACSEFLRKNYPFKLIFILAVIEARMFAVRIFPAYLLGSKYCFYQAILNNIFTLANNVWVGFICFEMYNVVIREKEKLEYGFYKPLGVILVLSICAGYVPIYLQDYGPIGAYCGTEFNNRHLNNDSIIFFSLSFGLRWLVIMFQLIVSFKVSRKLKVQFSEENQNIVKKIEYYPIILMTIYIPLTICRMLQLITSVSSILIVASQIIIACEGVLNFIVYGVNNEVKSLLKKFFNRRNGDLGLFKDELVFSSNQSTLNDC